MLVLFAGLLVACAHAAPTFYVDCSHGSDTNTGTPSSPFASLSRAQVAVRASLPAPPPGITVYIQGDCISRDATGAFSNATQLIFNGGKDSGAPGAPVTWTAWPGGATPRLLGGVPVPSSAWAPAGAPTAPGTLVMDLSPSGIDVSKWGFGALASGGLGSCTDTIMELFYDGVPQVQARFPNIAPDGTWEWLEIVKVENTETTFFVNGTAAEHALTWPSATTSPGSSSWLHGYWSFDWSDSYVEVKNVTSDGRGGAFIRVEANTPPVYGFLPKARFYGVNILSELDVSGEYYIDMVTSKLYWMPPPGGVTPGSQSYLSVSQTLITQLPGDGLTNVVIDGLELYYARGVGVSLGEGTNRNVTLTGLTSAMHGHKGVELVGSGVVLGNSHVYGTGCGAVTTFGGDLATLTPSGNIVENNHIHDYARITRTYNPGIGWFGSVGGLFRNNSIHNAPHNGMLGGGALNTFEGNTFDTLLFEATDSGAFYVGRSWTQRGNVVRKNTFRNIRATEKTTLGYPSVQAIYLDDEQSGYVLEGNVCEDSTTCFFVGGGRDVIVRNNICRNTGTCLHLDDRGLNWQRDSCTKNSTFTGDLVKGLIAVNYQHPPYSTAFPEIVGTLENRPCTPVNVSFTGNFGCNVSSLIDVTKSDLEAWGDVFVGNSNASKC